MKKNKNIDPLDKEMPIRYYSELPDVDINDELLVFERKNAIGCSAIMLCLVSIIFYFFFPGLLILLYINLLLLAGVYVWNYKYKLRRKPLLVINKTGITYKNTCYEWEHILELLCAEEYNPDSGWLTSVYIRFNYHGAVRKIDISGLSRPIKEIIHYIHTFRGKWK